MQPNQQSMTETVMANGSRLSISAASGEASIQAPIALSLFISIDSQIEYSPHWFLSVPKVAVLPLPSGWGPQWRVPRNLSAVSGELLEFALPLSPGC